METAKEATRDITEDIGDVLIYALYPTTGLRYLKWKYGLEKPPADTKAKTLDDVKREDDLIARAKVQATEKEKPTVSAKPVEAPKLDIKESAPHPAPPPRLKIHLCWLPCRELSCNTRYRLEPSQSGRPNRDAGSHEDGEYHQRPSFRKVKAINYKSGERVGKDAVLAIIG